jgi:hypothetical protein
LLSSLRFGAFLAYSPHGRSPAELASQAVCRQIKRDGYVSKGRRVEPVIPYAIRRLRECLWDELAGTTALADLLAPDVVLVPAPGSAPPPPRQRDALWVPHRICVALLAAGFGSHMEPLLARRQAVRKSAAAGRRQRPGVLQHYESFAVRPPAGGTPARIVLVDDVITRGATLLAGASRLAAAFPAAEVSAFALVRTQRPIDYQGGRQRFRAIVDPATALVTLSRYGSWRRDP